MFQLQVFKQLRNGMDSREPVRDNDLGLLLRLAAAYRADGWRTRITEGEPDPDYAPSWHSVAEIEDFRTVEPEQHVSLDLTTDQIVWLVAALEKGLESFEGGAFSPEAREDGTKDRAVKAVESVYARIQAQWRTE